MLKDLTVVIPTYNRNDFLIKILDSIPKNINVIVSDNGGTITNDFVNKYSSFSFVYPDKKLEMFENWNFCISKVKTKWFIIPSDDDFFYEGAFVKIENTLEKYKDTDIILFGYNIIDEHDNIKSTWSVSKITVLDKPHGYSYFKYGVEARFPGIVFNTTVAKQHGLFDESYVYTAADSLLIQKCMLYGNTVILPDVIAAYRIWPNNLTTKMISSNDWLKKIDRWQDEILAAVKREFAELKLDINIESIKDEVYGNNLINGIINQKRKTNRKDALNFFLNVRFPWKTKLTTKLRIINALITK